MRVPKGHDVTTDPRPARRDAGDFIVWGGLAIGPGTSLMTTIEFEPGTYEVTIAWNRQIITVR